MLGRQMELVDDETEIVPLYYHMFDNFEIQFGREEFCLVTGLKFRVEYWADYNDEDEPIPFRRQVFLSSLDGILLLVLLGVEDRRVVPDWILRLANGRDGWDKHPWGSYVWPTLYYQLRDANIRRWPSLYATKPTNEVDKKTYSIFGFTWAFKVFRAGTNEYYTRHRRSPSAVAWSPNKKFYRHMLCDFLHGRVPAERLIPDEIEAGSSWWVCSRAYFDGRVSDVERIPRHLNRQNHYELPSELYQEFQEQRSGLDQMMKHGQNIFKKMNKFMEDRSVGTGANKELIIVDQHYGINDLSGFQSMHGGLSSFQTSANNSFFNMGTPTNWQTPMPSQPGSSNWQSQMPSYTPTPNWQPPIPSYPGDAGLCDPSPYTHLPPTTVLPKKRVDKTKKKCKNDNVSPLNLGNDFAYDNVGGDDVVIMGVHDTGIYFTYENVDPNKVYMPINVGGNHWVTGAVNLPNSIFYVFDSMESQRTRLLLEHQIKAWTPVINGILQMRGYFHGSERQPHNFILSYNQGWGFSVPQQANFKDCGVITCWLIAKLCVGHVPIVPRESESYWENIRYEMGELFYKCRCENTRNCGYD
ncbi:phospholipase-like protein [Tanacetum coccineum]